MDAALTIPKPKNITLAEAATIGVGIEVSLENLLSQIMILTTSNRLLLWEFLMAVKSLFPIPTISLYQRMNGLWFLEVPVPLDASVPNCSKFSATKSSLHVAQSRFRYVHFHAVYGCVTNNT